MNTYIILAILLSVVITMGLRALPFAVFRGKREMPESLMRLGKMLPSAIMAVLVVYCLKDVNFTSEHYGASEMLCIAITVVFHAWRRQMMLSIFGGTAAYMLLVGYLC